MNKNNDSNSLSYKTKVAAQGLGLKLMAGAMALGSYLPMQTDADEYRNKLGKSQSHMHVETDGIHRRLVRSEVFNSGYNLEAITQNLRDRASGAVLPTPRADYYNSVTVSTPGRNPQPEHNLEDRLYQALGISEESADDTHFILYSISNPFLGNSANKDGIRTYTHVSQVNKGQLSDYDIITLFDLEGDITKVGLAVNDSVYIDTVATTFVPKHGGSEMTRVYEDDNHTYNATVVPVLQGGVAAIATGNPALGLFAAIRNSLAAQGQQKRLRQGRITDHELQVAITKLANPIDGTYVPTGRQVVQYLLKNTRDGENLHITEELGSHPENAITYTQRTVMVQDPRPEGLEFYNGQFGRWIEPDKNGEINGEWVKGPQFEPWEPTSSKQVIEERNYMPNCGCECSTLILTGQTNPVSFRYNAIVSPRDFNLVNPRDIICEIESASLIGGSYQPSQLGTLVAQGLIAYHFREVQKETIEKIRTETVTEYVEVPCEDDIGGNQGGGQGGVPKPPGSPAGQGGIQGGNQGGFPKPGGSGSGGSGGGIPGGVPKPGGAGSGGTGGGNVGGHPKPTIGGGVYTGIGEGSPGGQ